MTPAQSSKDETPHDRFRRSYHDYKEYVHLRMEHYFVVEGYDIATAVECAKRDAVLQFDDNNVRSRNGRHPSEQPAEVPAGDVRPG